VIDWQRNGKFLKEHGYFTKLVGDDAIKLIDQQDGKNPSSSISPRSRPMRPISPLKVIRSPTRTSRTRTLAPTMA